MQKTQEVQKGRGVFLSCIPFKFKRKQEQECRTTSNIFERYYATNPFRFIFRGIVHELRIHAVFRRNLVPPMLSTLQAMERQYGWTFSEGGNYHRSSDLKMRVEERPLQDIARCIATSYLWGEKKVIIDLVQAGVPVS